jgi:25S rRNA (uracil2843-N3)-methyltransferase
MSSESACSMSETFNKIDADVSKKATAPSTVIKNQEILNILRKALKDHINHPQFQSRLARIKQFFFVRDYESIFTSKDFLGVYAAEYLPHRTLCYRSLFLSVPSDLISQGIFSNILCLGSGNGSELMALASIFPQVSKHQHSNSMEVTCQDLSDYQVLPCLMETLKSDFPCHFQDDKFTWTFSIGNLVDDPASIIPYLQKSTLVTAFFLLNELFAMSKKGFALFIKTLIENMPPGTFLMVADSAGSFSESQVGNRQYMVYNFLDAIPALEQVYKIDAQWFRPERGLQYPLKLNSMRYFVRLYQKI